MGNVKGMLPVMVRVCPIALSDRQKEFFKNLSVDLIEPHDFFHHVIYHLGHDRFFVNRHVPSETKVFRLKVVTFFYYRMYIK